MFLQKFESADAPAAVGNYSPAVKLGDFVYVSGQIGIDPATGEFADGVEGQAKQIMQNIANILAAKDLKMHHIVKTTIFLENVEDFGVVDKIYGEAFDAAYPYPARSCVAVDKLPKGAKLEIECLVIDTLAYEKQMAGGCSGCSSEGNCSDAENGGCSGCQQ